MKKLVSIVTALTLSAALLAGCGPKEPAPTAEPTAPVAGVLKTGLSVVGGQGKSKDATAEKAGTFQTDVDMVAVIVDENGVIVDCAIDVVQAKASFDTTGAYTFPETVQSKVELGDGYNMRGVSSIGAEWFEQAAALTEYFIGKTADEVKGIALTEDGKPADADLLAGCTMSVSEFVEGVVSAAETATDLGAKAGDKLSLAAMASFKDGKNAGEAQSNTDVAAVTMDAEGRVTSCIIDVLQSKFAVDANGVITSDITAAVPSKNTLGDGYNMRGASSINAEWNEQAAAFAAYINGMTADEINGLAVTEDGKAADADLLAGCTLTLDSFQPIVTKAIG